MAAIRMIKFSSIATLAILSTAPAALADPANEGDLEIGRKIYMKNCEVCHLIGRNLVNPAKEIQNSKIIDDPKKLKEFLSHKNGVMPPFSEIAKNDVEIKHLREFLQYAKKNPSDLNKHSDSKGSATPESKSEKK